MALADLPPKVQKLLGQLWLRRTTPVPLSLYGASERRANEMLRAFDRRARTPGFIARGLKALLAAEASGQVLIVATRRAIYVVDRRGYRRGPFKGEVIEHIRLRLPDLSARTPRGTPPGVRHPARGALESARRPRPATTR